jgi:predicted aminopeptidase
MPIARLRLLRRLSAPLLALLLGGCSTLDYYAHLGQGQWQLLQARQPVAGGGGETTTEKKPGRVCPG